MAATSSSSQVNLVAFLDDTAEAEEQVKVVDEGKYISKSRSLSDALSKNQLETKNMTAISEEDGPTVSSIPTTIHFSPEESSANSLSTATENFKTYRIRWIGMLAIISFNISTGLVWLTFNAVANISAEWLHCSLDEVNLSVILYFIGYIVMSSFSGFVFEKWGIKKALILGGILNLIGTWIRYFASFIESTEESRHTRLVVLLLGQFIAATGQPFFLNSPPKYSAVWFGDSSRTIATTIGSISNPIGAAVGMVIVPELCQDITGKDMPFTLLVIAIVAVVALIPALLMSAAPPSPPSASAELALAEAADESFLSALKKVSKNGQFWILCLSFAVFVGLFNAFSSLINQIVVPYDYTDDDAGLFGACLIVAGIFGAGIAGGVVDKWKNYKTVLRLAVPFLALGYVGLVFVVEKDNFALICCVCVIIGFCSFGVLPVALELGVEVTYPAPPSTSTSVLWMGGQTLAVIFLVSGNALRNVSPWKDEPKDTLRTGLIAVAGISCVTALVSFAFNSPYYRMEAEEGRRMAKLGSNNAIQMES